MRTDFPQIAADAICAWIYYQKKKRHVLPFTEQTLRQEMIAAVQAWHEARRGLLSGPSKYGGDALTEYLLKKSRGDMRALRKRAQLEKFFSDKKALVNNVIKNAARNAAEIQRKKDAEALAVDIVNRRTAKYINPGIALKAKADAEVQRKEAEAKQRIQQAEEMMLRERKKIEGFNVFKYTVSDPKALMAMHNAHPATLNPYAFSQTHKYLPPEQRTVADVQVAVPPTLAHMLGVASKALKKAKTQVSAAHQRFDRLDASIQANNLLIQSAITMVPDF